MDFIEKIKIILPKEKNLDLVIREVKIDYNLVELIFFSSLCNEDRLIYLISSIKKKKINRQIIYRINNSQVKKIYKEEDALHSLFDGEALLFVSSSYALKIDVRNYPLRGIEEPKAEKAIRGSKDGFNESLNTSIALIRRRIKTHHLKIEPYIIGKYSLMNVALIYMDNKVDPSSLERITKKLKEVKLDSLIMSDRALEEAIFNQNKCLYPLVRYTERPDVASIHLLNGKMLLVVDTSSSVIVTPVSMFDHLRHVEEFRQTPIIGSFTRLLRIIAVFLSLFLVPTYLCVLEKTSLANVISISSPEGASLGIFTQSLIASVILEIFRIAIVHTPSPLSSAISLVSAIILGQVSMDLGVFSPEILLFVCIASICGFANPSYELSLVNKFVQIILIIIVWIFGVKGYVLSILFLFIYLVRIKVLDVPYLYPFCPFDKDQIKYTFIRPSSENNKNR